MTTPVGDPAFDQAVAAVADAVQKAKGLLDDFAAAVNLALETFPLMRDLLMKSFNDLVAKFTEALDLIWRIFTERGDAGAIRDVANWWIDQVGQPVTSQAGGLDRSQLESFGKWSGNAADAYLPIVLAQKEAITAIRTVTVQQVPDLLTEVADTISSFWFFIAAQTAGWLAFMVICAFTSALGGLPAAIAATAVFVGVVSNQFNDFANTLSALTIKFNQQKTLGVPFPGGNWPGIETAGVEDGSVLDADKKSDWTHTT